MTDEGLPVAAPPFAVTGDQAPGASATVAGVVLAAGTSSRFGERNKLLASWRGDPLVRHATRTLCAASVDEVVVVVGHEHDRVRSAVADLDAGVVYNRDYEAGQATSVRRGVAATRERGASAAVFALGDMPDVTVESVDALLDAYRAGVGDALAAACEGRRGNPVLFGRRHFESLSDVAGDTGGREILLRGDRSALVETGDPGVLADVDRPEDIREL
jgi:molybdenum cofactor cytidylyltransferase